MVARPLTKGEIALARSVFGKTIDYDRVTISDGKYFPLHPQGTGMAPNGRLYMYGCFSTDYSRGGAQLRSFFIHEMTHVWQYQNKILDPVKQAIALTLKHNFNYAAAYPYKLESGKKFTDYNMEQQASIVEDFFMRQHYGLETYKGRCRNVCNEAEKDDLYRKVLHRFPGKFFS